MTLGSQTTSLVSRSPPEKNLVLPRPLASRGEGTVPSQRSVPPPLQGHMAVAAAPEASQTMSLTPLPDYATLLSVSL